MRHADAFDIHVLQKQKKKSGFSGFLVILAT